MPDSSKANATAAADAAITSGLLGTGRAVALASGLVLLMATGFWIMGHPIRALPFFGSVALALLQGYFAQRVRFDADIFAIWATRWQGGADPIEDLSAFDSRIGRKVPTEDSVLANLAYRKSGALRLLRYQMASSVLQLALTGIALWP